MAKRAMEVWAIIALPREESSPLARSVRRKRFCSANRKLGAMALTRISGLYSWAMRTASHSMKLHNPALAAEYAGMRVSRRKAFMEETFRIAPVFWMAMLLPKT